MRVDRRSRRRPAPRLTSSIDVKEHGSAVGFLMDWLESQPLFKTLDGVGHRVVHGMLHTPARARDAGTAGRTQEHHALRSRAPAARNRTHRGRAATARPIAASRLLRHGVSSQHAARRHAIADSAPLRGKRCSALWLSWPVVHLSDAGTGASRRSGGGAGPRHPRAFGQRRQPCGGARRPMHRHQHGVYADGGIGHGHAIGGSGSRAHELSCADGVR